ncbi:MAG: hypothetical protein HUU56_04475 [Bdellovibrionaceae bacterium]|nr:hypothetical protein [Pseudobdellovibrionaceae bacterium]
MEKPVIKKKLPILQDSLKYILVKSSTSIYGPMNLSEVIDHLYSKKFSILDEITIPLFQWNYIRENQQVIELFRNKSLHEEELEKQKKQKEIQLKQQQLKNQYEIQSKKSLFNFFTITFIFIGLMIIGYFVRKKVKIHNFQVLEASIISKQIELELYTEAFELFQKAKSRNPEVAQMEAFFIPFLENNQPSLHSLYSDFKKDNTNPILVLNLASRLIVDADSSLPQEDKNSFLTVFNNLEFEKAEEQGLYRLLKSLWYLKENVLITEEASEILEKNTLFINTHWFLKNELLLVNLLIKSSFQELELTDVNQFINTIPFLSSDFTHNPNILWKLTEWKHLNSLCQNSSALKLKNDIPTETQETLKNQIQFICFIQNKDLTEAKSLLQKNNLAQSQHANYFLFLLNSLDPLKSLNLEKQQSLLKEYIGYHYLLIKNISAENLKNYEKENSLNDEFLTSYIKIKTTDNFDFNSSKEPSFRPLKLKKFCNELSKEAIKNYPWVYQKYCKL